MARSFGDRNRAPSEKTIKKSVHTALDSLINAPVSIEDDIPAQAAERVALLLNRIKTIQEGEKPNRYQTSFIDFMFERCYTKDEAKGGVVALLPKDPYIYDLADYYFENPLILVEKSRRVRVSWITCIFDIWIAAGGQDPRWPSLMRASGDRQVILASRKLQDIQGSQWFLEKRIKFVLDQLEERDIRSVWPAFPEWEWTASEIEFSNRSFISAIPQGADQARGPGATLIHVEELSTWEHAQESIEVMVPVLEGGGHLIAISTPKSNTYAHRIVSDELKGKRALW